MPTLSSAMVRENNHFTVLRLALALAVVLSHAFSVTTGTIEDEPLTRATGFTLGEHAVNGFFAISGFLVTMSFDRRGFRDYVLARALRIAPGLIVATLVVALVFGSVMTVLPLGTYWRSEGVWRFIVATLTTYKSNIALPGVFENNPFRFPMGTVWTLKYEVLCYGGVLLLGVTGLLRSRIFAAALVGGLFVALLALAWTDPAVPKGIETALRLPLIFACGGALYVWRDTVRLSAMIVVAFAALTFLLASTALYTPLLFTGTAYAMIWIALSPALSRWSLEPRQDLSYGTYLYGWPVQQSLHALFPLVAPLALLVPALVLTLAIASLSWMGVEKPALALKARALGRRTLKTIEPAAP
ncbi:acyltransferase family protein [Microvirga antarctica]|uniref:acyltransferase family protein n=1 Tax=Microvirga antarctica TaxID=2819233 RepID=UPI001B30731A|nr:acyltransferase [Microvirga antarctica]